MLTCELPAGMGPQGFTQDAQALRPAGQSRMALAEDAFPTSLVWSALACIDVPMQYLRAC